MAVTQTDFAKAVLQGLGAPVTQQNIAAMVGWENAEGGNWNNSATFNPLNTTLAQPGSRSVNSVGVQAYTSWNQGVAATLATLKNGQYRGILSALQSGNNPGAVATAIGSSPWGTDRSAVVHTIAQASGTPHDTSASSLTGANGSGANGSLQSCAGTTLASLAVGLLLARAVRAMPGRGGRGRRPRVSYR